MKTKWGMTKPPKGAKINFSHPLARKLTAYWLFNEGLGNKIYDLSGNNNTGTFVNTPTWKPGKFGSAIELERTDSDYIEVPNSPTLNKHDEFTVTYWEHPFSYNPGDQSEVISKNFTHWYFGHQSSSGDYLVNIGNSGCSGNGINSSFGGTAPPLNEWVFVAWTVTSVSGVAVVELFENGISLGTKSSSTAQCPTSTSDINIGRRRANDEYFDGLVDNITIHNRILSDSEIIQLYKEPFAMFDKEVHWKVPVVAGTKVQINIGDTWKTVEGVQINIGDTWKEIF